MNRIKLKNRARFVGIVLTTTALAAACTHEQHFGIEPMGESAALPAIHATDDTSDLSPDRFLQLVDRHSWPRTVIAVPRAITLHDPSYMTEAQFARDGQPWSDHPTLVTAQRAEPGRGDDTKALPGELLQAGVDLVFMPLRMIIGPHPHDALHGPAADWALLPERTRFDPGWFQPMGTAEAPIPYDDVE